ncbi:MAG: AMP-binding protein [Clostridium sp.]|nr:AMP-binding protein [Clostridium sp.]
MIALLKKMMLVTEENPDLTAVVDREGTRRTTYRELTELSDRIAAYLLARGIGPEDVVAIRCGRSMEYIASHLAVMKAGAAWVGVEDLMGEERIQYILRECHTALVLDENTVREAASCSPLAPAQYADPEPHRLAFIAYTSGSTGRPKGAAHEYGIYDAVLEGTGRMVGEHTRFQYANIIPETFIGGIYITAGAVVKAGTIHMLPLSMVKAPGKLLEYFEKQGIEMTFMPPALAKALLSTGRLKLLRLHVGGEIVSGLCSSEIPVYNIYGPTEFGYPTCIFRIDHPYANTPVGTVTGDTDIRLVSEEGDIRAREGILCIHLPYFRGYLNESIPRDMTEMEGRTYFRTDDYACRDENGVYTILGRADEMVKINGNRIDPSEVEAALRKVMGTDEAACAVRERDGVRFLCAWHTAPENPDPVIMEKRLKDLIPAYMIPSCYVKVDRIPRNTNGKIDRTRLPAPEDREIFAPYAPARTPQEEALCRAFEEVLHIKDRRVGIDDDFFLLGGDSMSAIQLVLVPALRRLTVPVIYRERTIRKIAEALGDIREASEGQTAVPEESDREVPLTAEQEYFLQKELAMPGSMIYHLPLMLSFRPDTDILRLKNAVADSFAAHPALLTGIRRSENGWVQRHHPEYNAPVTPEMVTEEELERISAAAAEPFTFDGAPLFQRRLFVTPVRTVLWMDVSHIICDGISLRILAEDILNAYDGMVLQRDSWSALVDESNRYRAGAGWAADRAYYEQQFAGRGRRLPKTDEDPAAAGLPHLQETLEHRLSFSAEYIREAAERVRMSPAVFYVTAAGLALSAYNHAENSVFTWTWNGRGEGRTMRTAGLLLRDIPIALQAKAGDTAEQVLSAIRRQVREGVVRGNVSYFMEKPEEKLLCFLYQGDLLDVPERDILTGAEFPDIPASRAEEACEVMLWEKKEGPLLEIHYDAGLYRPESMERYAELFAAACLELGRRDVRSLTFGELQEGILNSVLENRKEKS